jgi:hypothetical protein
MDKTLTGLYGYVETSIKQMEYASYGLRLDTGIRAGLIISMSQEALKTVHGCLHS